MKLNHLEDTKLNHLEDTKLSHLEHTKLNNIESQHTDLQQNPNLTMFGSIFNFNIMLASLDFGHHQKSQKQQL